MPSESESEAHVIRLRLPCETPLEFYAKYAKHLAGAFFVAQELPLEEEGRVSVHVSLAGSDLKLTGAGVARPSTKNGRRGVVIQLEELEEVHAVEAEEAGDAEDAGEDPFDDSATRASELPGQLAARLRQSLNLSTGTQRPNVIRRDTLSPQRPPSGEEAEEIDARISMTMAAVPDPDESSNEPAAESANEPAAESPNEPAAESSNEPAAESSNEPAAESSNERAESEDGDATFSLEASSAAEGEDAEEESAEAEAESEAAAEIGTAAESEASESEAAAEDQAGSERAGRGGRRLLAVAFVLLCGGIAAGGYLYWDQVTALWYELMARF